MANIPIGNNIIYSSIKIADVADNVEIKKFPSIDAETVKIISDVTVQLLDKIETVHSVIGIGDGVKTKFVFDAPGYVSLVDITLGKYVIDNYSYEHTGNLLIINLEEPAPKGVILQVNYTVLEWRYIKYKDTVGYVKNNCLLNIRYKDSIKSRETILLGAERVDVGVNSGNSEIATDKISGYKYERDAIDSRTVYNLRTQKRGSWFALDLETGKRGWYPGSIQVANIIVDDTELKQDKDIDSLTIEVLRKDSQVKILDIEYDSNKSIWYLIDFDNKVGYVRNLNIGNIWYVDPY